MNERDVLNLVRLEAAKRGLHLWRNNNGACTTDTGSFVRYGLANESKAVNSVIKSGDLIGIRPVIIEAWMIGGTIGQFVSRECKASNWKYSGSIRDRAQQNWCDLINRLGGDAMIITGTGSL